VFNKFIIITKEGGRSIDNFFCKSKKVGRNGDYDVHFGFEGVAKIGISFLTFIKQVSISNPLASLEGEFIAFKAIFTRNNFVEIFSTVRFQELKVFVENNLSATNWTSFGCYESLEGRGNFGISIPSKMVDQNVVDHHETQSPIRLFKIFGGSNVQFSWLD